jgi:hypothetical protein
MKQIAVSFIAIACISALALAGGQSKDESKKSSDAKSMKVTGEVVDVSCYLAHGDGGKGESHMSCGQACAKNGGPLGILTKDGKLYVSVLPDDHKNGPNALLMDHVSHTVVATGVVRTKGGTNGIMITKVEMPAEAKQ